MGGTGSLDGEELPVSLADWIQAHPCGQCRQFGPLPSGWTVPVLSALTSLDHLGAEVLLCKFKLGSLRLRVRPQDLSSASRAARIERIIDEAQEDCARRCTNCGLLLPMANNRIDGANCGACMPS